MTEPSAVIATVIDGLEARRSDLARGIVVVRSRRALGPAEQRDLIAALAEAGITDAPDADRPLTEVRALVAVPWAPPTPDQVETQRAAAQRAGHTFDLEHLWFIKLETAIDGVEWYAERMRQRDEEGDDDDDDDPDRGTAAKSAAVDDDNDDDDDDAETDDSDAETDDDDDDSDAETDDDSDAETDDDDDDDDDDSLDDDSDAETDDDADSLDDDAESMWRGPPPPLAHTASFEIERYPEILSEYDWEDFGIAIKLGGDRVAGEESVINAFFALWLSVYQDERAPSAMPFREADVMHDREHRSALLWVDHIDVPVTPADQVHFLIWLVATLGEIVPIVWSRFDHADLSAKSAWDSDGLRVVLAGNPMIEHTRRSGEEAALAWADSQALWSPREIAAMLIELALTYDPDEIGPAAIAERLLTRAATLDPESEASGLRATVWIRQGRFDDALAYARESPRAALRVHVLTEVLAHASSRIDEALALIEPATFDAIDDSTLGELAAAFAEHASTRLDAYLRLLPSRAGLVPHLYNASFDVPRQAALSILGRVIELPEPVPAAPEDHAPVVIEADDDDDARRRHRQSAARRAYVMAWNNACIHAHALGLPARAAELADGAQRFATENPHIYHSAACAYLAAGQMEPALGQVRLAIACGYQHLEKMESDPDLARLAEQPAFIRMFRDWRAARDDLN